MNFAAIDFETADQGADSACAVGIVRVKDGVVVSKTVTLIRPPRSLFQFTYVHGISWSDVKDKPTFAQLWPTLLPLLADADFFAAHNASFDRRVLTACCLAAGISPPPQRFLCTVQLARKAWDIRPTKLPDVCRHLGIELTHHEALSDAAACAQIVLAAHKDGAAVA